MNRYDHQFRGLPALVKVNAANKVLFALSGIVQHRNNGFKPEDDDAIVRQFDLSGMAEFWSVVLSEPMKCADFSHALAVHFMVIEHKKGSTDAEKLASRQAANQAVDVAEVQLQAALRRARIDGEPWFIEMPEPPLSTKLDAKAWLGFVPSDTYIEPPPPPADGVDLSRLKVRPRAAVEWLLAMPMRRHLVPPSLAAALQAAHEPSPLQSGQAPKVPRKRGPKGEKTAAVASAMQSALATNKHTRASLKAATEESLVAEFGTSRYTCREALKTVLSE